MPGKPVSRRRFLKITALSLSAATVTCCGLGYAAAQSSPATPAQPVDTPSFTFEQEDSTMKKVLVTYATRTGYTIGIAQKIGETLAERGFLVDVKPVHADPDPANYQAVVIGSAVNGAKWLPEAVEYVKRHQQALHKPQVALFCVHILNLGDSAASQKNRKAYLNVVRPLVSASSEGYFAGKGLDPKETSAVVRWIMRVTKFMPEGDCRDWLKIAAWAQSFDLDNL